MSLKIDQDHSRFRNIVLSSSLAVGIDMTDIAGLQPTSIAQVDFAMRDHVPNEFVRVNPLGLQVSYFRVDQAFEEGQPNGR